MVSWYNNTLCIEANWLYGEGNIVTWATYKNNVTRRKFRVMRKPAPKHPALVSFEHLEPDVQEAIVDRLGRHPRELARINLLAAWLQPDLAASRFFADWRLNDGSEIKPEKQRQYHAEACLLNAIGQALANARGQWGARGRTGGRIWDGLAASLQMVNRDQWPHSLPLNPRRLAAKYREYATRGYEVLVHGNWNNQNSRKAGTLVERLLISIYCMDNLPFGQWVHDYYLQFLSGVLTIADAESGEIFDREDFKDRHGNYLVISQATVWNILNKPENKQVTDLLRSNRIDHITKNTPYNHRTRPRYSLSKISMDDRTLPRKTLDGQWVNLYYAFDLGTMAVIGATISLERPSKDMVRDCFADMYSNLSRHQMKWPAECEVENHIMRDLEHELRAMFPYVTFCTPGISRSKGAEHGIKGKKYGDEKLYQKGIGRWNARGKAYLVKSKGKDPDYKEERLPLEQIISEEIESITRWNHGLHPDQKRFPGKTRWQVLQQNQHPDLLPPPAHIILKQIGHRTPCSIRNNDFVRVQYEDYAIENFASLTRLKPNNYEVEAYWIEGPGGEIPEVYLYQGDNYICRAHRYARYNEAKLERTEADEAIRTKQASRQAHFFKREKELKAAKFMKVALMATDSLPDPSETIAVALPPIPEPVYSLEPEPAGTIEDRALDF